MSVTAAGSATDPAGAADTVMYSWQVFDAGTAVANGTGADFAFVPAATGTYDIVLTVADEDGGSASVDRSIIIDHVAPAVDPVVTPPAPVAAGSPSPVTVTGAFADADAGEVHTVVWNWGDGDTTTQIVQSGDPTALSASHFYQKAGAYAITLTVTDDRGGSATVKADTVIVYDPSAGYVTGAGWLASPAGAVAADPQATGRAYFRLGARYPKKGTSPVGNTRFRVQAAGFRFRSTGFDWLLVDGDRAEYRGTGKLNGKGDYGIRIVAIDGRRPGVPGVDRLQVTIWDKATGQVVYDSQAGSAPGLTNDDAPASIGGGAIRIVKPR
jgi:PKD repeat protein